MFRQYPLRVFPSNHHGQSLSCQANSRYPSQQWTGLSPDRPHDVVLQQHDLQYIVMALLLASHRRLQAYSMQRDSVVSQGSRSNQWEGRRSQSGQHRPYMQSSWALIFGASETNGDTGPWQPTFALLHRFLGYLWRSVSCSKKALRRSRCAACFVGR